MSYSRLRSAVGATVPFKTIEIEGIKLAFNDDGEGLTVVCLHAICHGAGDFKRLRASLCQNYRVIAIDFPSHGNSEDDSHPVCISRYTALLWEFLDQLKLEKVILIGNSIGGSVALQYTFSYPERVQGLILENPGGLDPMDSVKKLFTRLMTSLFSQGHPQAWWYKKGFTDYYRYLILPGHKARQQREKIIASVEEIALSLTQAWQSFAEESSDLRYVAISIKCPVLFTWASQDRIVQLGRCLPTIKEFPNMTLKLFPAAHCPHLETPEEFETAVVTFLERIKKYDPIPTHSGNPTS